MNPVPKPEKQVKQSKRKCKNCKEVFVKKNAMQQVCSVSCAASLARINQKKEAEKKWKREKKKKLEKLKTVSDWKNDLQKEINWIARHLDSDYPCISHPEMKDFLRYDAGHYYTVKAHSDLRYNLHNLHKQNSNANERYGGGADYARGLRDRYGQEYLDMVLNLPLRYEGTAKEKFTIKNIRDTYLPAARQIVRDLKAGKEYSRDEVNKKIGIYQ